ncbi:uncharacterized protein LOC118826988 [Colossoma macropomum]|uniref:uncharacterized protein LOC118826988 n=1 Tax=Colossoma macropomum TaxID=42526 RepID=UPI0018653909|nr:uncharacterized protein LOC118826988 [Colossoma macropomum]
MQSCSSALCVLILLITTVTTSSGSASLSVTVKLNDSATLPCSERCSGLVTWTVSHKPTDVLAECDQTSCRSVKEGYQMIHDQYLKGNLSLTITDADFTKRDWYTCTCNNKDICDVALQLEPLRSSVQMKPGETLVLDLDVSDPVEVIYNSRANGSSGHICIVDRGSLECTVEYAQRASLTSALELKGVTPSDSGVYTIQVTRTEEVIHVYTVTIQDDLPHPDRDQETVVPVWGIILLILLVVLMGGCFCNVVVLQRRRNIMQRWRKTDGQRKKEKKKEKWLSLT